MRKRFLLRLLLLALVLGVLPATVLAASPAPPEVQHNFELPVQGSTGYAIINCKLRQDAGTEYRTIATVPAGDPFLIFQESEDWLYIQTEDGTEGWISKNYTMINLPDVLPSIRYNASNGSASLFRSKGLEIPGVTGQALYTGKTWNERLKRNEYMMPVLFRMAEKIAAAQKAARAEGNTLVLYESYRPYSVQKLVCTQLGVLASRNGTVSRAINGAPWNKSWFISTGVSNHQKGYAIDVSLARVDAAEQRTYGAYAVDEVTAATEYTMQTAMHELSPDAARLTRPVNSSSATAWKSASHTWMFNAAAGAVALERYCTGAGLTPLASEWWHFNDLDAKQASGNAGSGGFQIWKVLSCEP